MSSTPKKKPPKKSAKKGSKSDGTPWRSSTWIGLLLFVSVWMFVVGILVGRGTVSTQFEFDASPKELQALAERANNPADANQASDGLADTISTDPFIELKNSETKNLIKNDKRIEKRPQPVEVVKKPSPKIKPKKQPKDPPPEIRPKQNISKVPPATNSPKKSVSLKKRIGRYRTLQTASVGNLNQAKRMVKRLQQKGYKAYVASAMVPGKGLRHRVRIGPYSNDQEAESALKRLTKDGIHGILLTNR